MREGFRHHIRRFFGWVSPDRHQAMTGKGHLQASVARPIFDCSAPTADIQAAANKPPGSTQSWLTKAELR